MREVYGIFITSCELNRKTRNVVKVITKYMDGIMYSTKESAQKRLEEMSKFENQYYVNSLNPGWIRQESANLNNPENCYSIVAEIKNFTLMDEGEDHDDYIRAVMENGGNWKHGSSLHHSSEEDQL